jgi:uncharacterized membrane protein YtjA (UPF0391 family)
MGTAGRIWTVRRFFFARIAFSPFANCILTVAVFVEFPIFIWYGICGSRFMLGWTVIFLLIALAAGILGFTAIAGAAAGIAKILFIIFLVLFLISLIGGARRTR